MKQKTNKRISKTFWLTGSGKVRRRKTGQAHFNARESGNTTKNKRSDLTVSVTKVHDKYKRVIQ